MLKEPLPESNLNCIVIIILGKKAFCMSIRILLDFIPDGWQYVEQTTDLWKKQWKKHSTDAFIRH